MRPIIRHFLVIFLNFQFEYEKYATIEIYANKNLSK